MTSTLGRPILDVVSEYRGSRGRGSEPPSSDDPAHEETQPASAGMGSVKEQKRRAAAQISTRLKAWRRAGDAAGGGATGGPASTGAPLGSDVRNRMEPKLGADLSAVKLHTGGDAADAAKDLNARAFTVGNDVHFGAGQFAPGTRDGDKLLAHELTHVVQGQRSGIQRKDNGGDAGGEHKGVEVSDPSEPAEVEADAKSEEVAGALHDRKDHPADAKKHAGSDAKHADAKHGDDKHASDDSKHAADDTKASASSSSKADAGDSKSEHKPAPIAAKLWSVALKIYRDGPGTSGAGGAPKATGGAGPGGTGGTAGTAPTAPADPLKAFHDAITANNRGALMNEWQKLAPDAKKKVTQADVLSAFDVSPATALDMMKSIGADFSTAAYMNKFLGIPDPAQWQPQLNSAGLWTSFIKAPPQREGVSKDQAKVLGTFVRGGKAREVFEKVYPKLQDATYNAGWLKTTPWGPDDIARLYRAFAGLPVAHVQASSGGFYLGTDENLDGSGFKPLGFAWQDGDKMVMPKNSSNASGGGLGHDMTGGTNSGATNVAGTPGGGPTQSHFVGSATHEVGHAVSNKCAGDAWSTTRNAFAVVPQDTWSKALFDDAAVDRDLAAKVKSKALPRAMKAADARNFLVGKITGTEHLPAKWSAPDAEAFVTANLSTQPLYAYWTAKKNWGDTYQLPASNIVGDKAYAYLTRFNNQTCTYKSSTYQNKVSWYSISSPAEWFAENYSHYYRLDKNHPEADVKKYFDDLDTKFSATAPGGGMAPGGGAQAGGGAGQAGGAQGQAGGAQGQAGGGAGGGGAQAQAGGGQGQAAGGTQAANMPPPNIHRMPFEW